MRKFILVLFFFAFAIVGLSAQKNFLSCDFGVSSRLINDKVGIIDGESALSRTSYILNTKLKNKKVFLLSSILYGAERNTKDPILTRGVDLKPRAYSRVLIDAGYKFPISKNLGVFAGGGISVIEKNLFVSPIIIVSHDYRFGRETRFSQNIKVRPIFSEPKGMFVNVAYDAVFEHFFTKKFGVNTNLKLSNLESFSDMEFDSELNQFFIGGVYRNKKSSFSVSTDIVKLLTMNDIEKRSVFQVSFKKYL